MSSGLVRRFLNFSGRHLAQLAPVVRPEMHDRRTIPKLNPPTSLSHCGILGTTLGMRAGQYQALL